MASTPLFRILEIGAWTAGALLLTSYAGIRTWSAYASDQGVDAMREARQAHALLMSQAALTTPGADPVHAGRQHTLSTAAPDTSTWDKKRLAEYEAAQAHAGMPEGVLRIPKFSLEVPIYEGTSDLTLNRGAGWIVGTANVDSDTGNIGIAAHRDGFFRPLKDIEVGDLMFLDTVTASRQYRVTQLQIVDPSNVGVLSATPTSSITLVTCYPFYFVGSAPQRFIVHAQIEQQGIAGD
ncbi:MAG TPA: class D sortase [Povalibacter sp.]